MKFRVFSIVVFVSLFSVCLFGQDLGSSNKLFGAAKTPPAKTTTTKKGPPKGKAAPKPKATAKKTTPAKSTKTKASRPKRSAATDPKTTAKKETPVKPADTTSRFREPAPPIGKAAEERYEQLIEDGNYARDDRNYVLAETTYKQAKAIKPKDPRAVYGLGNLYSDQQRWDEAEAAYRNALQIEPNDAFSHIALSYVLTQPISTPDLGGRYEEAEKLAKRAISLAPRNALAHDQLGVAMELRGLVGVETESTYRRAIQLDPSFAPAYAHLGRLLRRRGQERESVEAHAEAMRRLTDVPTMILVAEVLQSEQRYKESEAILQQAIVGDPKNPAGLLLLGRALMAMGSLIEAESILKRSLAVSPNGFAANSLLGTLYTRHGKLELAENVLLQASRSVPEYEKRRLSQQFEMIGDAYLKAGKRSNAERAYRQAISLDTETESLTAKLARARNG